MGKLLKILALSILFVSITGCAPVIKWVAESTGVKTQVIEAGIEIAINEGDALAKKRFNEQFLPVTGLTFDDYDANHDGNLDFVEFAFAYKDFVDHKPEGTPLGDLAWPALNGAVLPALYFGRKYWIKKKAEANRGKTPDDKEVEGD